MTVLVLLVVHVVCADESANGSPSYLVTWKRARRTSRSWEIRTSQLFGKLLMATKSRLGVGHPDDIALFFMCGV
jgi:hypothetical protein